MLELCLIVLVAHASADGVRDRDITIVARQGVGTAAGRAAWRRIANGGPELLLPILRAMDTSDIVAANWLRTAFDRIVARHRRKIDAKTIDSLLAFAAEPHRNGRARRFALEVVEMFRPGSRQRFVRGKVTDPEFRYDAIEVLLDEADAARDLPAEAKALYRTAFTHARDVNQARRAAAGLLRLGIRVSLAKHFGFLTDWYIIGPFDAPNKSGFRKSYPPEKGVDLAAVYPGQSGPIRWKFYRVKESSPLVRSRHVALVNLREPRALGDADDAVAFAFTRIRIDRAGEYEFRGAADDNFTIWVNGKKVFAFEEYNNGVRHDRHRFRVALKKGTNTILVKVCQSPPYIAPNWEFFLRILDVSGNGARFEYDLPKPKRDS